MIVSLTNGPYMLLQNGSLFYIYKISGLCKPWMMQAES